MMLTLENILKIKNDFENRDMEGAQVMRINNPYTHLRTLLDDESKHDELNRRLYCVVRNTDPETIWFGPLKQPTWQRIESPDYTTSLDALIPLWPDRWHFTLKRSKGGDYTCDAQMSYRYSRKGLWKETPALAMLDALLQVLEYEYAKE